MDYLFAPYNVNRDAAPHYPRFRKDGKKVRLLLGMKGLLVGSRKLWGCGGSDSKEGLE